MAYDPAQGSIIAIQRPGSIISASVFGTVGASILGSVPVKLESSNASVITVGSPVANQSVSGTVGASVIGHAPVVIVGGSILTSATANQSVSGTVQTDVRGSIATVIIGGSIASAGVANQSVSGAVQIAGRSPDSILSVGRVDGGISGSTLGITTETVLFGETTAGGGGTYVAVKVNPSGTLQTEAEVQGSVVSLQGGPWRVSVVNSTPSSLLAGVSVIGLTPVNVTNQVTVVSSIAGGIFPISGSVAATITNTNVNVSGSVAAWIQSSNGSVITNFRNSSIIAINAGSVIALMGNTSIRALQANGWTVSVVGVISPTATVSSMKAIASTTTLLASNTERKGATITNFSGTSILVRLGNMATVNNFSFMMNNNDYYETPFNYSGIIQHYASSTAGFIQVTEIT